LYHLYGRGVRGIACHDLRFRDHISKNTDGEENARRSEKNSDLRLHGTDLLPSEAPVSCQLRPDANTSYILVPYRKSAVALSPIYYRHSDDLNVAEFLSGK